MRSDNALRATVLALRARHAPEREREATYMNSGDFVLSALGVLLAIFFGEALCSFVGYILVSVFSFGAVTGQRAEDNKLSFPWHGFVRAPDGRLVVQVEITTIIGAIFLVAGVVLFIMWRVNNV